MNICSCDEFKKNMPRIDGAVSNAWIHGYELGKEFVYFRYCPWCSKKMVDEFVGDSDHDHDDRIL